MNDESSGERPDDSAERILFEIRNQVAWITIDSPDRGNALTPAMRDRLGSLMRGLNGRFEARAAVITATGDAH
jgi:2-(1,2-epoxy-1,2-dihydrophenyl)acetyl-CoA isomerase